MTGGSRSGRWTAFQTVCPYRPFPANLPRPESVCRHSMSSPTRHFFRVKPDVFQAGGICLSESEKYFSMMPGLSVLPGDFRYCQPGKRDKPAVVHDTLELSDRFDEFHSRFPVRYLLRNNPAPAEGGRSRSVGGFSPCRLCQEQVTVMVQERAFIEVPLKTPGQELSSSFPVSGW